MSEHSSAQAIRQVLTETHAWAVVGCSPDPRRDSHRIARMLQGRGFRVIPVNPRVESLLGERCYPTLRDIPATEQIDVVDISGARTGPARTSTRRLPSAPGPSGCSSE